MKTYASHSTWVETITTDSFLYSIDTSGMEQEYREGPTKTEYQPECICGWVGLSVVASDENGNYADKDETALQEAQDSANQHEGEQR